MERSPVDEVFTEAEKKFERWRKTIGLFAGPAVAVVVLMMSFPSLSVEAHRLAAVLSFVVIYWVTEAIPIPVTALLGPALCVVLGVDDMKSVFAPFANPIIFLFLGSFLLAAAMSLHGLDRRFALAILSSRWIGGRPGRLLIVFGGITAFMSMWISNTAATAIMFPIALGILAAFEKTDSPAGIRRYSVGLMLMIAYSASVGGIGTIVGSPPNLIAVGLLDQRLGMNISFFEWMIVGVPVAIAMFAMLSFLMSWKYPAQKSRIKGIVPLIESERKRLGRWSVGERNVAVIFGTVVTLWILPGFLSIMLGHDNPLARWYDDHVPEAVAALIGAALLFIVPVSWRERRFTMRWVDAVEIDWGTILLFGGGLSLGYLMFQTGLSEHVGNAMVEVLAVESVWGLTALAIILGTLITEVTSNTASSNMIIPVFIAISETLGVSPVPPVLGACLGASCAFMLPISTPPNAIIYGSRRVPIGQMVKAGVLFDIAAFFIIWIALRVLCPILGWS